MNQFHDRAVAKCLDFDEELTEWESEFIHSLADLPEHVELTDKQAKKLNSILQKVEFGAR